MKLQYFFLMSTLISFLSQAQHIVNTSTKIEFNGKTRPLFEWIRDYKNKKFGKTEIIETLTNTPPFEPKGTIKTLNESNFNHIAKGFAFYCSNVKKENKIHYGVIVINHNQHPFDRKIAKDICLEIRNSYIRQYRLGDSTVPNIVPSNSDVQLDISETTSSETQ